MRARAHGGDQWAAVGATRIGPVPGACPFILPSPETRSGRLQGPPQLLPSRARGTLAPAAERAGSGLGRAEGAASVSLTPAPQGRPWPVPF
jgi:hypothetical protein